MADFQDRSLANAYAFAALLPHAKPQQPAQRFIRRSELRSMVGLSDTAIYEMEKRGDFPRRIALAPRVVVWDLTEVEAWMEKCRQNRTSGAKVPNAGKRSTRPTARRK